MKITKKLVDSLSLTHPGRRTPDVGGSNLLHFQSIQIYFGEELDLELKQYLESLRYRYEDNPDLYLNNVVVILHHGQNLHIMRNSKEFTDYWDSSCPAIKEKLEILKKMYPECIRDYTTMITSLLGDWQTALKYLQNRLEQVSITAAAWEELIILKDRQITRGTAASILEQIKRKIKDIHTKEAQIIINSVPGGTSQSNVPNPTQRALNRMHCEFKLITSKRKFFDFYKVTWNPPHLTKLLRYYDM